MLYNNKQQVIHVPAKFNTKDNPSLFASLRETKQLSDPNGRSCNGMFSLGERAKFVQ